ncbi:MAG: copper transporter [Nocardioidaceae bacterium]
MIDFRYHLISIIAIFLALAAGITLGAGPFHDPVNAQVAADEDANRQSEAALRGELASAQDAQSFENAFAESVGTDLLSDRLKDRSVALFMLPGADDAVADGLSEQIEAAGGSVTAQVEVADKMIDPGERQFAEGVARQSLDGQSDVPDTSGMSSYQLLGAGLARAYLTDGSDAAFDATASTVASAYREAGFIEAAKEPSTRAGLAVFVTGETADTTLDGQDELVATTAATADAESLGAVIAGPASSADEGGAIHYVRDGDLSGTLSTVDTATVSAGQVVTVLALQREVDGRSGHYGAGDGADQAMPDVG